MPIRGDPHEESRVAVIHIDVPISPFSPPRVGHVVSIRAELRGVDLPEPVHGPDVFDLPGLQREERQARLRGVVPAKYDGSAIRRDIGVRGSRTERDLLGDFWIATVPAI